jgi:hypothetical protein
MLHDYIACSCLIEVSKGDWSSFQSHYNMMVVSKCGPQRLLRAHSVTFAFPQPQLVMHGWVDCASLMKVMRSECIFAVTITVRCTMMEIMPKIWGSIYFTNDYVVYVMLLMYVMKCPGLLIPVMKLGVVIALILFHFSVITFKLRASLISHCTENILDQLNFTETRCGYSSIICIVIQQC